MTTYSPVKRIDAPDGLRYVEIRVSRDVHLFRFVEMVHGVEKHSGYEYWYPAYTSGLFADAQSAEREAVMTIEWLRQNSN